MNNKKFSLNKHNSSKNSIPKDSQEEIQFKVYEKDIMNNLICEEFCYGRNHKSFPSKSFGIENLNYLQLGIKNKSSIL